MKILQKEMLKTKVAGVLSMMIMMFACSTPSTIITGSWKSNAPVPRKYNTILVANLTNNTIAKSTVENEFSNSLSGSVTVVKSIEEFPPHVSNSDSDKVSIMKKVKNKKIDAILTISLISKETQTRYVPGRYPYNPIDRYDYYGNFWGYYNNWYPYGYTTSYYAQDKIYFMETNLYDAKTEKLIWSAQSHTYSPSNIASFSKDFATVITARMRKEGIIN